MANPDPISHANAAPGISSKHGDSAPTPFADHQPSYVRGDVIAHTSRDGLRRYRVVPDFAGWRVTRSESTGVTASLRHFRRATAAEAWDQLMHLVVEDLAAIHATALVLVRAARNHAMCGRRPGFRTSPTELKRGFSRAMEVFATCCRDIAVEWEGVHAQGRRLIGRESQVHVPDWLREIVEDLHEERAIQAGMPPRSDQLPDEARPTSDEFP